LTHEDSMEVQIMYVDSYGNAYLNILYDDFVKILNGRKMRITVGSLVRKKLQISGSYFDSEDYGETGLVLTVSATGYLELALLHNSAEELMGIEVGAKAVIQFE
ncbi:MAG: SAM-dependent chlorinase/fluorinase, partial [Bacteroidales bacterium]|nr:SAM-dependent chlorinase/fluorinase [Bacteroidales bacterium]